MKDYIESFLIHLKIRGLSSDTIEGYSENLKYFLRYYNKQDMESISLEEIFRYIVYLKDRKNQSHSYINQQIASIKFFLCYVIKRNLPFDEIPYLKESRKLPQVLKREELMRLFNIIKNLKHRAIFYLLYSSGIRPKELTGLRFQDIKTDQMSVYISESKGGLARYALLSPLALDNLITYWRRYPEDKSVWLFPGPDHKKSIQVGSLGSLFRKYKKMAKISSDVSLYSLRHSFATHLLEDGINLRIIQTLMGHRSVDSTLQYLHVSRDIIEKVKSPLDLLYPK